MNGRIAGLCLPAVAASVLLAAPAPSFAQVLSYGPGTYSYQIVNRPGYGWTVRYGTGHNNGQFNYDVVLPDSAALFPTPAARQWATLPYPTSLSEPASVHVRVPADAQVFFDDTPMWQTGTERRFITPPLSTQHTYTYRITAQWLVDGKEHRESRIVRVTPGLTTNVDFSADTR